MSRFYRDHDVSLGLALLLRNAGHDSLTAQEARLAHAGDDVHLLFAAQQERVLLTHNRKDYVLLHEAWQHWPAAWGMVAPPHSGILVLDHRPEYELAEALATLLVVAPFPPINALYWWRSHLGWQRQRSSRLWVDHSGS